MSRTAFIVTPCSAASFADVISRGVRRAFATKMVIACAAVRVAPPVSLALLLCFPSTTAASASALSAILYVTFLSRGSLLSDLRASDKTPGQSRDVDRSRLGSVVCKCRGVDICVQWFSVLCHVVNRFHFESFQKAYQKSSFQVAKFTFYSRFINCCSKVVSLPTSGLPTSALTKV
jgi:hypothetical protein